MLVSFMGTLSCQKICNHQSSQCITMICEKSSLNMDGLFHKSKVINIILSLYLKATVASFFRQKLLLIDIFYLIIFLVKFLEAKYYNH